MCSGSYIKENMCIYKSENKCKNMDSVNKMAREVQGAVTKAKADQRLICGLLSAITYLEGNPEDVLLCLLPDTKSGDSASHMQTVLLQAFCYENYIPVIQVDSSEKLAELCGIKRSRKQHRTECFCAIVIRDKSVPYREDEDPPLSPSEKALADFYECTFDLYPRPIIQLSPPVS